MYKYTYKRDIREIDQSWVVKIADTLIEAGDTLMEFERASGWEVFNSVMEQKNIQLVTTNFRTLNDAPVLF